MRHFHRGSDTLFRNGKIYFSIAEGSSFVSSDGTFITRFHGDGSFRGNNHDGHYLRLNIKGGAYCHRIVYEVCSNSEIPDGAEIDHINGDGFDNRFENLRVVFSRKENMANPNTRNRQLRHLNRIHNDASIQAKKKATWKSKRLS